VSDTRDLDNTIARDMDETIKRRYQEQLMREGGGCFLLSVLACCLAVSLLLAFSRVVHDHDMRILRQEMEDRRNGK
jgi:hypothetical protein